MHGDNLCDFQVLKGLGMIVRRHEGNERNDDDVHFKNPCLIEESISGEDGQTRRLDSAGSKWIADCFYVALTRRNDSPSNLPTSTLLRASRVFERLMLNRLCRLLASNPDLVR